MHGLSAQDGAVHPLKSRLPVGARRSKSYLGVRRDEAAMARAEGASRINADDRGGPSFPTRTFRTSPVPTSRVVLRPCFGELARNGKIA